MKKGAVSPSDWDRGIGLLLVALLLATLFISGILPALFHLLWHYLLCGCELLICFYALKSCRRKLALTMAILLLLTAVLGFLLVFHGPFLSSGKTLFMYLTRYAHFSLSVFLFPLTGWALFLLNYFHSSCGVHDADLEKEGVRLCATLREDMTMEVNADHPAGENR